MESASAVIAVVLLLVVTGVLSFRAGMHATGGKRMLKPKPADVTVTLSENAAKAVTKDLYPPEALVYCDYDVSWAISNNTGRAVMVELKGFKDKPSNKSKEPIDFQTKSTTIQPGETKSITGKVKDKSIFAVEPKGTHDAIGEYQDFVYSVVVDGQVLDPEVRVRK